MRWPWLLAALLPLTVFADKVEPQPALKMPLATRAVFLDLAAADGRIVAVGERGIVVYSDDAGTSWTQADTPVNGTLTSVAFVDERTGYAVGHDAVILKTTDGGQSWTLVHFDAESENVYLTVRVRTPQWVYVLGTNGQLVVTQDGGTTWDTQTLAVEDWYQNHLFDVAWSDGATLVAAEKGVLYRSDDGIRGWAPLESPYEGSFFGARVLPDRQLAIYGMSGRLFLSADAGATWRRVDTQTAQFLLDGAALPDGRLVVAGGGGVVSVVDPASGAASTNQRRDRVGITAVLVHDDRAYLANEAGGINVTPLEALISR